MILVKSQKRDEDNRDFLYYKTLVSRIRILDKGIVYSISNNRKIVVGPSYPGAEEGAKGLAVRQLKGYASWVSG